jgi:hypothetical protein
MVRPVYKTYTPSTASLTGFASNVTGSTWTLSANSAPDGLAHQVTLQNNSINDHSSLTATFVGIDQDGITQTQTINMPGPSATVTTSDYFKTLISVTPSATIGADTMNIGYNNQISSQTFPLDVRGAQAYVGVFVTGTINYTVQYTGDDVQGTATRPYDWQEDSGTSIVNSSSSGAETFTSIPIAIRFITNSYSAGAVAKLTISQMNPQSN